MFDLWPIWNYEFLHDCQGRCIPLEVSYSLGKGVILPLTSHFCPLYLGWVAIWPGWHREQLENDPQMLRATWRTRRSKEPEQITSAERSQAGNWLRKCMEPKKNGVCDLVKGLSTLSRGYESSTLIGSSFGHQMLGGLIFRAPTSILTTQQKYTKSPYRQTALPKDPPALLKGTLSVFVLIQTTEKNKTSW